jgi:hypothetical protein
MDMKKLIATQVAEGENLIKQLKEAGKTDEEIHTIISKKGYRVVTISKLFHASGRKLTVVVSREDKELAGATIEERKDARKPIREKEIEDAAWVHRAIVNAPRRVLGSYF